MRIADLIIETYICESALLKTEKIIDEKGIDNCETEINMTRNHLQSSLNIARISSEEIIMSTTRGLKNRLLISIAKKLTYPLNIDMKETRRSIAERLHTEKKYTFSI
jgi:hypothetical protein